MEVSRIIENKKLKKLKTEKTAQSKIKDYKQGKMIEDELCQGIIRNK